MAKIIKEDEPFERIVEPREKAIQLCRDLEQRSRSSTSRRGWPTRDRVLLSPGRVHRPVPRAARARRQGDRGLQAALGGRGLLEGRRLADRSCSGSTAPPCSQEGPRRPPGDGSKRPRRATTACWASSWSCSRSTRRSAPGWSCGCPRGPSSAASWRTSSTASCSGAATSRSTRPAIGRVRAVRDLGPLSVLRRQPVPADRDGRRRPVPAPADELPAPHHDLPVEAAQLSRPAAAAGRVRHGVPLRAVGRADRDDPRARLHPGRRPHLLHRGAGGRRVPRLHRDDPVRARARWG